ncbi:MAG: hypothetical protein COA78_05520 [Blastopirellula sp.]|nr:MAG: hypothetical protein COA78_05520 [Blastopirellula sp.]
MIRRFLCLLLVPLMLANQGLCFAHSHFGTDILDSEGHSSKPHFHAGDHNHYELKSDHVAQGQVDQTQGQHSDRMPSSEHDGEDHSKDHLSLIQPSTDHDADAVYYPEAATLAHFRQMVVIDSPFCLAFAATSPAAHQNKDGLLLSGQSPNSVFYPDCPIYLSTLSLRI